VFFINVPIGPLSLATCYVELRDPDYLTAQRADLRKQPFSFDSIGLSLLVITMVCLGVMLRKEAGRSILARPDAGDSVCRRFDRADRVGVAPPQPRGQFQPIAGKKLHRVMHHNLLRLRRSLWCQHFVAYFAPGAVWL
jgi:hypothetical protein